MLSGLHTSITNNFLCSRRSRCLSGTELEILCKIVMTLAFEMITSHVKTKDTVWVKYDLNNFY